jgi:glucokinase
MQRTAIAIDLGGTKCAGALINAEGRILESEKVMLGSRQGDEVAGLIHDLCFELFDKAESRGNRVIGMGISVPGISDQDTGVVWAPNIPGWSAYPLKKSIETSLPSKIPVMVDNDRACCILGETWLGAAKNCRNAIFLTVGTGIGAGILIDGRILRGADDIAGAIGWLALESEYLENYRQFGCFEYHASGDGLVRETEDLLKETGKEMGSLLRENGLTASAIIDAYEKKDKLAEMVISRAVRLWGKASANLVSLFNPEIIIFGGGLFGPAQILIDAIRDEAARWAQPVSIKKVRIVGSLTGSDAPLLGAAKKVLEHDANI